MSNKNSEGVCTYRQTATQVSAAVAVLVGVTLEVQCAAARLILDGMNRTKYNILNCAESKVMPECTLQRKYWLNNHRRGYKPIIFILSQYIPSSW
jgi:hypothetical protein